MVYETKNLHLGTQQFWGPSNRPHEEILFRHNLQKPRRIAASANQEYFLTEWCLGNAHITTNFDVTASTTLSIVDCILCLQTEPFMQFGLQPWRRHGLLEKPRWIADFANQENFLTECCLGNAHIINFDVTASTTRSIGRLHPVSSNDTLYAIRLGSNRQ